MARRLKAILRPLARPIGAMGLLLVGCQVALAGGVELPPGGAKPAPWQIGSGPPMRLGFPVDRWAQTDEAGGARQDFERCRRWRTTLSGLGETFAGFTLRAAIADRYCALSVNSAASTRWEWPWRGLEQGLALPPRALRQFGAWEVRCGEGRMRERCALVQKLGDDGASTHFVIDRVAGREMLLWRLYLPLSGPARTGASARMGGGSAPVGRASHTNAVSKSDAAGRVKILLSGRAIARRFTVCGPQGCVLEISGKDAGAGATRLSDGLVVQAQALLDGDSARYGLLIRARGFRDALRELGRLRRAERHVSDE